MDAVAEGLWGLADYQEQSGEIGKAVKCLEAICQSDVSFFPIVEVKTRLRIATLLLKHSHNVNHAKAHLERAQLLLKSIPSCFDLKCRAYSLLSQCYHLVGSIAPQKQVLHKALELTASGYDIAVKLWSCNFNSQLANALIIEGDYQSSIAALDAGYVCATQIGYPELQMFFATCMLHVHLMHWEDESSVERAAAKCDEVWEFLDPQKKQLCLGLFFYNELLHIFYRLRVCDYKNATPHIERLDAAMKADLKQTQYVQQLTKEFDALNESLSRPDLHYRERLALSEKQSQIQHQLASLTALSSTSKGTLEPAYFGNMRRTDGDKLELAPPPIDGEWLPKSAVYALVDLMMVVLSRPKGNFRDCGKRIQSGMHTIEEELLKLGITDGVREVNLQHSAIWMAGVYLMLLMQFLENKVAMELTRSEFVEAQEALVQMKNWFIRFPTILQTCESIIEMLRGQYAHSVGCYSEAAFHFIEAVKLTESKSMQALCQIYAAVSYICIGDSESSTQALDLIGPVYRMMDSFVGVREKTNCLFAYGLLLMKQQDLQEARNRLAKGLQMTHNQLGNLQLVSQYLTILGSLALALHDAGQAREILRSSLTLAKKLSDIPTQIWVLSVLTALYQELGEKGSEMENVEFQKSRMDALQQKLIDANSSIHHIELIDTVRIEVQQFHEVDSRSTLGPAMSANLDIPESVGLSAPMPGQSTSRLVDIDIGNIGRRGKRKM
ncbi:putative tetratricopeptide-like helical domain, chromatid cohesion factor MAU2 [Rosa chinensis]|uniref:Putative tetratricopeptide-like helical domain, chromatid cohesion factor MAU2 n=1 Tax=Rosa chinensis TaxID=74649 RepID=A0A2P6QL14_ROSCH|nr:sister chromatid cohesion protein SCC4 [Rosa chinensis]PRQ34878.1 putative tetratricopeptide-like helical domain, chromatid cohesion factor MAU2 [Rosa chinensis]